MVAGLVLLLALAFAGNWAARLAGLAVPGSVLGMLALALLLETGVMPMRLVQPASDLLVRHLALFYVPAGVAVLVHVAIVRNDLLPIVVAALASLIAVLVVVGVIIQRFSHDE